MKKKKKELKTWELHRFLMPYFFRAGDCEIFIELNMWNYHWLKNAIKTYCHRWTEKIILEITRVTTTMLYWKSFDFHRCVLTFKILLSNTIKLFWMFSYCLNWLVWHVWLLAPKKDSDYFNLRQVSKCYPKYGHSCLSRDVGYGFPWLRNRLLWNKLVSSATAGLWKQNGNPMNADQLLNCTKIGVLWQ